MSYPPYRHEDDEREFGRRRQHRDEESEPREREPERFRRDHAASFENEDRPFEDTRRFPGRERESRYFEDWQQPRGFGAAENEWGAPRRRGFYQRYGAHEEWEPQRYGQGFGYGQGEGPMPRRYGAVQNEWQQAQQPSRFGRGSLGGLREERDRQRFGEESEHERWGGDFAGRGPKNYRRSDPRIQEEVCDRLTSDPQVDASEIQVSVKDGEITLEGSVAERRMKRLAEDCAESVAGVSQVHNRLRIEAPGAQHSPGSQGQGSSSQARQSSGRTA